MLEKDFLSKEEITENYDFVSRQTDYYSNAGKYLGLINTEKDPATNQIGCYLTDIGKEILTTDLADRQVLYIRQILSYQVFNKTLKLYFEKKSQPSTEDIVKIMKKSSIPNIKSESTFERRTSTVLGWINWILEQLDK